MKNGGIIILFIIQSTNHSTNKKPTNVGIDVVERDVDRTELYLADEIFLAGTALGITPVGLVDRITVSDAIPGRITTDVDKVYSDVARGSVDSFAEWRTPVYN